MTMPQDEAAAREAARSRAAQVAGRLVGSRAREARRAGRKCVHCWGPIRPGERIADVPDGGQAHLGCIARA